MSDPTPAERAYGMSSAERLRRHVRSTGPRAFLGAVSTSGITAGFLSAADVVWPLLAYIALAAVLFVLILIALGLSGPRLRYLGLVPGAGAARRQVAGRPVRLELVGGGNRAPLRRIEAARADDPVYAAGLRVLLPPSRPLLVIPSNRRDVGREHELLLPLFADRSRRSHVEVDLRPLGVPLPPYAFARELPEGVQDVDHTLAVKDLVFTPELAAALLDGTGGDLPVLLPEHCVDPLLLAERDVVVIGGPDTNFWHGALFEPAALEFTSPHSSVPLAFDLRDEPGGLPTYGSRSMTVRLGRAEAVFPYGRGGVAELDERLYPTYGMVLTVRNPYAAALGRSHWVTFVAGTRSLGTSGAVLALTALLRAMRRDPERNFFSLVPTDSPDVVAPVSAVLCRTVEVEQAALRRDGQLQQRLRRRLPPEGLDPHYSDTYVPVEVEYLSYGGSEPRWESVGRLT